MGDTTKKPYPTASDGAMFAQWRKLKDGSSNTVLLIMIGDRCGAFGDDVRKIAEACNLPIEAAPCKDGEIDHAKFPAKDINELTEKLVAAGHRVTVCELKTDSASAHNQ